MALTIDVGKIKINWRGTYNSGTAYEVDDAVSFYDGATTSAYICIANSTGNDPSTNNTPHASWNYLARGTESASGGTADGQIQYKTGTGFAGETGFSYDAAGNTLTAPNVTVTGDLTVQGSQTTVSTTNTTISDNTIVLNSGETGAGIQHADAESGIEIERGTELNAKFAFNETNDYFEMLLGSSPARLHVPSYSEKVQAESISSGSVTIDLTSAAIFTVTLTENVTGFTVSGEQAAASTSFILVCTQDGTGGRTVDLTNFVGRTVKWAGGVVPTVSTNPNTTDIFLFTTFNGGTVYYGFTSGQEF
tara:strand:+ start:22741 stop:23658 length:918 start_codon:yes stop_codon:yes gene_type:complete